MFNKLDDSWTVEIHDLWYILYTCIIYVFEVSRQWMTAHIFANENSLSNILNRIKLTFSINCERHYFRICMWQFMKLFHWIYNTMLVLHIIQSIDRVAHIFIMLETWRSRFITNDVDNTVLNDKLFEINYCMTVNNWL